MDAEVVRKIKAEALMVQGVVASFRIIEGLPDNGFRPAVAFSR